MSFVAPGDPVPVIRQLLARYYNNYPQEKVYLQLDKSSYSASETIWLSGYVTCQRKPSDISSILYLELFNDKGFIINRAMLPVQNGTVTGQVALPTSLPAGNYFLRGYTAWMMNFSNALYFYRKISVTDNRKPEKKTTPPARTDFSIQFFPEGGQLVSRLTSMVAFRATDSVGLPVTVTGKVFNSLGDTLASIQTIHDGTGSFIIHCTPQTTYTALVTANGITKKVPLPVVQNSGIVLHTETRNNGNADSVFFHVSRSGINHEKFENLILCARMENHFSVTKIHFSDNAVVNDPLDTVLTAPFPLLLNNFPPGVLQLTVLSDSGNVLAERLLFLRGPKDTAVLLKPLSKAENGQTNFTLALPAQYAGTMTVSVTDAGNLSESADNAVRAAMLLSPEINRRIHEPEWYFEADHPDVDRALDILLASSKTATIDLQHLLAGAVDKIKYLPEQALTLHGRAFEISGTNRTPLVNSSLFLILKAGADSLTQPISITTDQAGFFSVPDLSFHDTGSVYIQSSKTNNGGSIAIDMHKTIADSLMGSRYVVAPTVLNTKWTQVDSLQNDNTVPLQPGMLQNVIVRARAKSHIDSVLAKYATGMFANPGTWAQTIDLTTDPITANSDQDVLNWLNGKAAGLNYSFSNGKPIIYWRYSNVIAGLSAVEQMKLNAPAFFLNEGLLSAGPDGYDGAIELLSSIRMRDVALIRIFKPGTMPNVPDNGPHGSIAIYLKNGTEADKPSAKINFERIPVTGYSSSHRFDETAALQKKSSTLYWHPSLPVDPASHTVSFSVNCRGIKLLRVTAEGIDENGKLVRISQVITVNE